MTTGAKKTLVALVLLTVSAAMVYGTWLAVDDMRAKPMGAQVSAASGALVIVNTGDFTWSHATYTANDVFTVEAAEPLAPGGRLVIPLTSLVDANDRALPWVDDRVREVTARATRRSRFPAFNVDRPTTGRWLLE